MRSQLGLGVISCLQCCSSVLQATWEAADYPMTQDKRRTKNWLLNLATWKSFMTLTGNSSGCGDGEQVAFLWKFVVNVSIGTGAGEDIFFNTSSPLKTKVLVLVFPSVSPSFKKILLMLTLAKNVRLFLIVNTCRKWVLVSLLLTFHVMGILCCFSHRCIGCASLYFFRVFINCMCGVEGITY